MKVTLTVYGVSRMSMQQKEAWGMHGVRVCSLICFFGEKQSMLSSDEKEV